MAWLSDITGKAETFLNSIDKGAATALKKESGSGPKVTYALTSSEDPSIDVSSSVSTATTQRYATSTIPSDYQVSPAYFAPSRYIKSSGYASSITSSVVSKDRHPKEDPDEKLLEYLNESSGGNQTTGNSTGNGSPPTRTPGRMSRQSSVSSLRSLTNQTNAGAHAQVRTENELLASSGPTTEYTVSGSLASYSLADRELSEMRSRVADLEKQIISKDSQLAILRVKLQEANEQVEIRQRKLRTVQAENVQLQEMSKKIKEKGVGQDAKALEERLEREKQDARRLEGEYLTKIHALESERESLSQQLIAIQKTLTEERLHSRDSIDQLKLAKYNLEANKQEFDDYKQKAQRILQAKESLIKTLKEGVISDDEPSQAHSELQVQLAESEQERDLVKEDLQQAQVMIYNMKADVQELESQLASEQRASLEMQRSLQSQAQTFQQQSSEYREQAERSKQECQVLNDEMHRQLFTLQSQLQEKQTEIERLTNQVAVRSMNSSSETELEGRVRSLTENLIQKQTVIETLQTEKQSQGLQLERLHKMYKEAESAAVQSASNIHLGNIEDGLQHRVPAIFRESPFDTGVTHSLKTAFRGLDTGSRKFGIVLRRYPLVRVFVFLYIILLHLWVMVVLLTYSPEIHKDGFGIMPATGPHERGV